MQKVMAVLARMIEVAHGAEAAVELTPVMLCLSCAAEMTVHASGSGASGVQLTAKEARVKCMQLEQG